MRLLHEHSHCFLDDHRRVTIEIVRVFVDVCGERHVDVYQQILFPIPHGTCGNVNGATEELVRTIDPVKGEALGQELSCRFETKP